MYGEIRLFRKSMFGGFDRRDVVGYISRMAEERNKFRADKEAAEEEARRLGAEAEELRLKLEESERQARRARAEALDEASRTFKLLETACDCVRASIEATSSQIRSELGKVGDSIAVMSSALKTTGERMNEILSDADAEERDDPDLSDDAGNDEDEMS